MAAPILVALKAVPWGALLRNAPAILTTADRLWSAVKGRKEKPPPGSELQALSGRVAALEGHDQANAELVKEIAQQVQHLTDTAQVLAARLRIAIATGVLLLAISIALALAALLR